LITTQENDQLTKVGHGTVMGNLLRQYWHPIASASQLESEPVIEVELLGEELVLFRDRTGRLGLLERGCAHRQTSLGYGIPEENGLRCAYHGWVWDIDGQCLEQPSEPEGSTYFERVSTQAYSVQELGGLVFAYLGTGAPPHLPRYNVLVWDDVYRETNGSVVPCNWLQVLENLLDPAHIESLHGRYFGYVLDRTDPQEAEFFRSRIAPRPMKGMAFDTFESGVVERHFTDNREEHSWTSGSPIFFPSTAMMVRNEGSGSLIYVVPLSDERTWFVEHRAMPLGGRPLPEGAAPYHDVPGTDSFGRLRVGTANGQDHMAVVTQGARANRRREHLGATDAGLIMYRQLLLDQARAFADGAEPINVRRGLTTNRQINAPPPMAPVSTGAIA
jgi:5,5'-dehydrodivanillate O-demethylase oxygenase subunit